MMTGERVWLTIQAPFGYVRVNEQEYWAIIKKNLASAKLSGSTREEVRKSLENVAFKIAQDMAEVIRKTVPVDTGYLQASIYPVEPGDPDLLEPDAFSGQILEMSPSGLPL